MKRNLHRAMSAMLLIPTASFAGVIVKTEQLNPVDPTWKFKTISGPSRSDIAQNAKVTVMGNQTDAQSTPPEALVNGRVPSAASDLTECVFLTNDNANAGSFVIDLGSVQPVAAVNSYSWHEFAGDQGARGPQVYTLFGSADAQTWTKIAVVDTRPNKAGENWNCQHGVNITDSTGKLGDFRFLKLDVQPTRSPKRSITVRRRPAQ